MNQTVPLREGLFTGDSHGFGLLASKCSKCKRVFFPARVYCPECFGESMEPLTLHGEGTLYSYTVSYMPTQHYKSPYAVGWIEFPQNVRVFAQITGWQDKPLKIGMKMKLIKDVLWTEESKDIIGYKFEPV
jgi:uncharacterized protein